ncbi:MAG: PIN domain-containing protein [Cyanobacteria bacterium J06621_11]
MSSLFVDTSGWANFFIPTENRHAKALEYVRQIKQNQQNLITTNYIMAELVALLGSRYPLPRNRLFQYIRAVKTLSVVKVIHIDKETDTESWHLCESRPDKAWSLVDASSFVVMDQLNIHSASTTDKHFEQAGFIRLLK